MAGVISMYDPPLPMFLLQLPDRNLVGSDDTMGSSRDWYPRWL